MNAVASEGMVLLVNGVFVFMNLPLMNDVAVLMNSVKANDCCSCVNEWFGLC